MQRQSILGSQELVALETTRNLSGAQELAAAKYTVLGWRVRDIVQTATDLQKAHVAQERYPEMQSSVAQRPGWKHVKHHAVLSMQESLP